MAKLPKRPALLNELALISFDQGRWKEALAGFQETLQEDPRNERALGWTVNCHRRLRDFDAAQAAVREGLAKRPRVPVC